MINNFEIPFLSRIGLYISTLGYCFKHGDFKQALAYTKYNIKNAIFRYRFKHSIKFREKYLSNLTADNICFLALMGMVYGDEEFKLRNCIKYLSDEEKEKYKKQVLETIQTTIKKAKLTKKEQIAGAIDMFGLDLFGVKAEDIKPKKTTKKRVKKTKVYSIPAPTVK